jgi:hypothetical protein
LENSVTKTILTVCDALNRNSVQYLIVGGTAVAFHGYFRWSLDTAGNPATKFDLDIWYNPTYDNYFRLLKALSVLGQDVKEFFHEMPTNRLTPRTDDHLGIPCGNKNSRL